MSWNYRIVRQNTKYDDCFSFGIHEAYYRPDGKLVSLTENPISLNESTIDGLKQTISMVQDCLNKPIVDYVTFEEV